MNYRVAFMEEAEKDLDGIEEYLSQFYESTVRNFFSELKQKVAVLEAMPYIYPAYEQDTFFRRMVFRDYLIFYNVDDKRKIVVVHRIFHSARDISRHLLSQRSHGN